ncbi:serine hydrolase [Camelimonas sp. ID_303_24]
MRAFAAMDLGPDGRASCLIVADERAGGETPGGGQTPGAKKEDRTLWRAEYAPDEALFVGSAIKTFILAGFLQQQEAGKTSMSAQALIDDSVRSLSSPVFINLTGRTPFVSVLEAMITHSDNTATDVALAATGPAHVRKLIQKAGLAKTRMPDSTRALFGWLAGDAPGVDPGWQGLQAIAAGPTPAKSRSPVGGDGPTMQSTASDLVNWHRAAMTGRFFEKPETFLQYRRIMAMADALPQVVPPDIMAWGKGGSIDWAGFHCFSLAGQMLTAGGPATFCFTINWRGPDAETPRVFAAYRDAVRRTLTETCNARA